MGFSLNSSSEKRALLLEPCLSKYCHSHYIDNNTIWFCILQTPNNRNQTTMPRMLRKVRELPCSAHPPSRILKKRSRKSYKELRWRYLGFTFLQIKVCWWKCVSTRSGTPAKSSLWRPINRAFAGKWSLITYPDPHLRTDGAMLLLFMPFQIVLT